MAEVTPVLTSKNLPTPAPEAPKVVVDGPRFGAEFDDIVAKPLIRPDQLDVRCKNPNVKLRWVNRTAMNGLRHSQHIAVGFVDATLADADVPPQYVRDGKIIFGDLILMKLDRVKYNAALKSNYETAVRAAGHKRDYPGVKEGAKVVRDMDNLAARSAGKLQFYQPNADEVQKSIEENQRIVDLNTKE